ncbi:kh domain-containing protein [Lichtheimia corymbifera JMRC:FSU:9682]|uniref:Kh domain-containing protein n=1 Tax=Lichtheimia corymbifera JMRC:FSU:9682 TaxID=1263082 RepID=A0A068RLQ2_9FUNG|nr:kh domain-containing protein [Lichtheimia corymbifera JMRC:FSU:9682]
MESTDHLDNLPPSARLALQHAQATHDATLDATEPAVQEQEPAVPSANDPVVVDNAAFAEPIIAGDVPMPRTPTAAPLTSTKEKKKEKLDLSSESAFPSLSPAGSAPRPPALSAWSSSSARVKTTHKPANTVAAAAGNTKAKASSAASSAPPVTEMLELPANQQIANLPSKPLGFKGSADVIQQVMSKTGTNIIASTNRSGTTTFLIQGPPTDVAKAKRELIAGLVVKRTVEIAVPAATRRFIIGTKGKNLQQIEVKSGVRINFPPRKDDEGEPAEDETVPVTLVGDAAGIAIAKAEIDKIVGEKTAKQTIKVEDIDSKYHLFLSGARGEALQALEAELGVKVQMPPLVGAAGPITISGDKEKVQEAKQILEKRAADLEKNYRTAAISVPKRQHKYLLGKNGETLREILEESGCTIEIPPANDTSDSITIRGPNECLLEGLSLAMAKAREVHVNALDLVEMNKGTPKPFEYAKAMLKYLVAHGSFSKIESEYSVQISAPSNLSALNNSVPVEFVSKDEKAMIEAYKAGFDTCRALTPELFATVDIEPHLHRHIAVRHARQIQRIKSRHVVEVYFANDKDEDDIPTVTLIYDGKEGDAQQKAAAAKDALEAAIAEIKKIAADSSDFVSQTVNIPADYHHYISGPNRTTLNAIIGGSDSAISVRFGGASPDAVNVRGSANEVKHVIAEINKIYDAAKRDEFVGSYATEFTIPAAYSAHVIGKAGGNINKLKEELGVKIDISDAGSSGGNDDFKSVSKKNKSQAKVNVVIQGIQTNVEAAKERIHSLVSSLADQTTLTLNVPREFHRHLIGPNGRYVRKLEDKYNVYIKFPKSGSEQNGSSGSSGDAITVRGRKKDASSAKEELMELYEYEKEEQAKWKEREEARKKAEEKNKN